MQREREDAPITKNDAGDEAKAMAKWLRMAWTRSPGRCCRCGNEIHLTMKKTSWGSREEMAMSVRCAMARGVERDQKERKGRPELTVIDGDPRRSFELERDSLAAEIDRGVGGINEEEEETL